MSRNSRYDILFEPVKIGPVTAPNRFYCTPHALGTGNQMPHTRAAMREVRAEGGWGVVNTGYCSIHPSSDDLPLPNCRLWDDEDIKVHALMVDAVHRHGALAGVELWHGGSGTGNRYSRIPLMSASGIQGDLTYPGWINLARSRAMDKNDIRDLRRWHVDAARRAKSAGFDIVYIYAGMNFGPYQFLVPWQNQRTDEYGGSLENRVRLTREILEDMKEAVGDSCAVVNDPIEAQAIVFRLWVKAVQWAGTTDPEVVRKTVIGMEVTNLSGGSATLLPNHHLSKPVYIGEIRPDGQYNVMWHSAANVDGNPWFDPTSSDKAQ